MILKVVAHLGDSGHKYNPVALSQLAKAWPSSRTVSFELDAIGAYSFNEGGQLMANASVLPFGSAPSLDVAYVAGISLISNVYTAKRMEAFTRILIYPTTDDHFGRKRTGGSTADGLWPGATQRPGHQLPCTVALCDGEALRQRTLSSSFRRMHRRASTHMRMRCARANDRRRATRRAVRRRG